MPSPPSPWSSRHHERVERRPRPERFSRPWYDVASLDKTTYVASTLAGRGLARRVAEHKTMFFRERDGKGGVIDYDAAVGGDRVWLHGVRLRQISKSNTVTVKVTGPRIRPDGSNTIRPPTMAMKAGMVWSLSRVPIRIGYITLSIPPTSSRPVRRALGPFPNSHPAQGRGPPESRRQRRPAPVPRPARPSPVPTA